MRNCWVTVKLFFPIIVEVDQADGDVFAIRAKGHRAFAQCPCGKFLVRLHQPIRPRAHDDGAQAVEHVIGPAGVGGDVGVQADQGVTKVGFDQHLLRLAGKVGGGDVMPA